MGILILGLVLFLGVHSVAIVAGGWREGMIARIGDKPWKGIYSVVSIAGFVLLIWGYGLARQEPIVLYVPPVWTRHVSALLMLPVFILLVAAYLPGRIKAGSTCHELAMSMDWMATMMAGAGVRNAAQRPLDGVNLLPVMIEGRSLEPRQVFWWYNNQQAMREGPWKLVVNLPGGKAAALYNLEADLSEASDVSAKHGPRVTSMQQALAAWKQDVQRDATQQPEK